MGELNGSSIGNEFEDFENNLSNLFLAYTSLKEKNQEVNLEVKELKLRISALSNKIKELDEKNKNLKLVNVMQGNEEYKQLMKVRLNKLIYEVDGCMKQLTDL